MVYISYMEKLVESYNFELIKLHPIDIILYRSVNKYSISNAPGNSAGHKDKDVYFSELVHLYSFIKMN